ncbi:MAG TPA: tRNA (adenosine(37)-N6)-threonylcarbamoyltransferase complex dimerization subunit type 1 TsaB [Thermoanaerobaculia bacterium]
MTGPLHLALDAGSPLVSVALARGGEPVAERAVEMERSSVQLLEMIRAVLSEAGARPADLGGVVALRGPGSFTGLRIGLATALGLHQALGIPATAVDTLRTLAAYAVPEMPPGQTGALVAVVDALRGDWSAQAFTAEPLPRPLSGVELLPGSELPELFERAGWPGGRVVVGFGVSRLSGIEGWPADIRLVEPGAQRPLASMAARMAVHPEIPWDAALLTSPLYSRPAAISQPKRRAPA